MRLGPGPSHGDGEERMDWKDQTDENEGTMGTLSLGCVHSFIVCGYNSACHVVGT